MKTLTSLLSIFIVCLLLVGIGYTIGRDKPYFNDIANRKYTPEYRCEQFSRDLVQKLKERGIQSEVVIGYQPDGTKHAWVGVWVDPQTGKYTKGYTK